MNFINKTIVFLLLLLNTCPNALSDKNDDPTPVLLWHGMGDSCCFSFSLGQIKTILEDEIPGVYVKSVRIGDSEIQDVENSYFKNANEQIDQVCSEVSNDKRLQNGYNAVGFSQGAQFLRAVAQRCPYPRMLNLISLGGQHQGVYGLPHCGSLESRLCDYMRRMINHAAYYEFVQNRLVQAEYWHDPLKEEEYKRKSIFLADINNELSINQTYKENLQKLQTIVLVKFENDTMVQPRETEWFGFYKPGQAVELQLMQETDLYKEDRIGLKAMDAAGKIHLLSVETDHLQFTDKWFISNIIKKYLL